MFIGLIPGDTQLSKKKLPPLTDDPKLSKNADPTPTPKKEKQADNGVMATALVTMQAIGKTIEPGDKLLVTQAAYVPGDYKLDNPELQEVWDANFRQLGGDSESEEVVI